MIGQKHSGYTVIGNINNRVVLAHKQNAVEPWVVRWLDDEGDPYGGSYFMDRATALNEFVSRASSGRVCSEC